MDNKRVVLIGFHNQKALGIRYLANALKAAGYEPYLVFFMEFNSIIPKKPTAREIELLKELLMQIDPCFVGLSVMSSLYLETVEMTNKAVREALSGVSVGWGGVYPTLEPERCAGYCDYVMRGEGEQTIVELLDAITRGGDTLGIMNLAYKRDGEIVMNDIRPLQQDIDTYGFPEIGGDNNYYIHLDRIDLGDPQLMSYSYEMSASRGCPFTCSYCCSISLSRLYRGKGKYVRFRSVNSVMQELNEAKKKIKKLRLIHFWDEIFSDEEGWIEEFSRRYKAEIGLPFRIWGHPLRINERIIKNLVGAGLHQIVVGIQSGSERVRKEVFHRPESREQIIESSRVLSGCGVPKVVYDFMLGHSFESRDELIETFDLCMELEPPFALSIHGLNYLPGTDIVKMALDEGYYSREEMDSMMYGSIQSQYDEYWGPNAYHKISADNVWMALIFLTQFKKARPKLNALAQMAREGSDYDAVFALKRKMESKKRMRGYIEKAALMLKLPSALISSD